MELILDHGLSRVKEEFFDNKIWLCMSLIFICGKYEKKRNKAAGSCYEERVLHEDTRLVAYI